MHDLRAHPPVAFRLPYITSRSDSRFAESLLLTLGVVGLYFAPYFCGARFAVIGGGNLVRILRKLTVPASESQMAIALGLSILTMSLMLCAILWQSNIIVYQRDLIRVIWPGH